MEQNLTMHVQPRSLLATLEEFGSGKELAGIVIISVMNMLANAGGIGGGGIMIPCMMIFFNLPIQECIPLANSFALISAVT